MPAQSSLILEIFTRAFSSKWLTIVFFCNIFGTGFLFPTEEVYQGFNSHIYDAIAGISVVTVLSIARKVAKDRANLTLSWRFSVATIALGTIAGSGFGALYAYVSTDEGVSTSQIPDLFVYAPISIFGQIFTFTIFVGALTYATHTSQVLAEERLALKLIQENLRAEVELNRSELIGQIETTISPVIKLIESDLKQSKATADTVEKIHLAIADVVRPLSHALDEQVELKNIGELDRSQLARKLRKASASYKLKRQAPLALSVSPLISLTLYFVFDLVAVLYLFDFEAMLKVGIPFIVLALGVFWFNRRIWGSRKTNAIKVFGVGVTNGLILGTLFTLIGTSQGYDAELITPIGFSVFLITLGACWFELALNRTRESRRGIELANIEIARSISEVRQKLWYLRKKIARELHGGLQAKLQVLALQMEKNHVVDPATLATFYDEMKESISSGDHQQQVRSIDEYLQDLNEFWAGITQIESKVSADAAKAVASNVVLYECIREVIREAINNAIKHAGANEISISLENLPKSQIQLEVYNNITKQISAQSSKSLGSKIFEELTDTWNLRVGADRSTLTAVFGINAHIN